MIISGDQSQPAASAQSPLLVWPSQPAAPSQRAGTTTVRDLSVVAMVGDDSQLDSSVCLAGDIELGASEVLRAPLESIEIFQVTAVRNRT